jgi:hypothetical protein
MHMIAVFSCRFVVVLLRWDELIFYFVWFLKVNIKGFYIIFPVLTSELYKTPSKHSQKLQFNSLANDLEFPTNFIDSFRCVHTQFRTFFHKSAGLFVESI